MAVEQSEQIVREAPDIEAFKLGLLQSAKALSDQRIAIPPQMVAQMSDLGIKAGELAAEGIGGYQPYLEQAGFTLGDAQSTLGEALQQSQVERQSAIGQMESAIGGLGEAAGQARGIANLGAAQQLGYAGQIPGVTSEAVRALQQAGALGTGSAVQGIAGLAGTTGAYDPTSAQAFFNPYEDAAVQQALADVARAGDIQKQQIGAQAVGAGAFGGSRQAVAEQELARNVLEQQGRTAAQMRAAGFQQAAQQAQQAYEQQQARAQQAAQLTGALGAQGAQSGLSAAQAAGQIGLQGIGSQADIANRASALGMSAEQLAGQLAGQAGSLGQGIGGLGAQYGQLGLQQGSALGTLGLQQASLGELGTKLGQQEAGFLFDLGKQQQAQDQAVLEAQRSTELQQLYEPYQRLGFLSDIYKGAPTSQQAITATSTPNVSPAQSILGLGVGALSAAAGASKAGLF